MGFTNDYKFISSRHSNLNFANHFVIYWMLKMARIIINTRSRTNEKPYMINSQFLQTWEGETRQHMVSIRWRNWRCCYFQTPSVDHPESATALARYHPEVQLRLRVTRRSWQKLFAGKNFVKSLVTAQTQLRSYSEQQRAFGNSNICNCVFSLVTKSFEK